MEDESKISILNKIKTKNIILEKIFPFTSDRVLILPHLVNKDILLKSSLRKIYKSLKKNNNLSEEENDTFYRFITYRILYEYHITQSQLIIKYRALNQDLLASFIVNLYRKIFSGLILNILEDKKCDIKYCPKNKALDTYVIDYFHYHKKITLFFPFYVIKKYPEYDLETIDKSLQFLENFKKEKINADLVCSFGYENDFIEKIYLKMDKYFIINNIFCFIDQRCTGSFFKKMDILYSYVLNGKNRENIKKIIFREYNVNKFFLEFFVKFYIDQIRNLNMNSLEEIIINQNKLFFYKPIYFNNIQKLNNEEINILKSRVKDLNLLYIDFQNESPYQENFIYFCNNFLSMNTDKIKNVSVYNIGKKNYDSNCYYLIKNKKPQISCKNLEKIIYENTIFNADNSKDEEEIKTFIDLFFYKEHYLYYSSEVLLNDEKTNKMALQFLSSNIPNFDDLVPAYINKNKKKINLKLYIRNIIIEFISSEGKIYLKWNKKSPLEFDFNKLEFILKKISLKISKINSLDCDYFFRNKLKKKMENNLCDSNILNLSQTKTIFRGMDSLYEIYYFHKHFQNFQFKSYMKKKDFNKIISDMIKAEKLKKKQLIIIKSQKGNIFGLYKDFRNKDKNLIFDLKNDKIIYNDINYINTKIKNDDFFIHILLKCFEKPIDLNTISLSSLRNNLESLEIYGLSLIS